MKTNLYLIEPFTNMHVGSGKENSGIVDNLVQKDILTGYPAIHSSSLKGAFREYFSEHFPNQVDAVFGKGNKKKKGQESNIQTNTPGTYYFFNAQVLSIPARSNKVAFLNATTSGIIREMLNQIKLLDHTIISEQERVAFQKLADLNCSGSAVCFKKELNEAIVEFYNIQACYCSSNLLTVAEVELLEKWLGNNFVLVNEDIFRKNIAEKLPIIARNNLDSGQSTNLWYEEFVPRLTRFYTFISSGDNKLQIDFSFDCIQIGANATVGYGFSRIFKPNR